MSGRTPSLPARRTRLLGREPAVRALVAELAREDVRLVTVTGTGGAGKTTLAVEAARRAAPRFLDGAAFVELGTADDAEAVARTIAAGLDLADTGTSAAEAVRAWLEVRELLLVLDNCEQVAAGAAALADSLLDACPGLLILATSRTPLRLRGEHVFGLPPLAVPGRTDGVDAGQLAEVPSVALFVERARDTDPRFRLDAGTAPSVAAICARLDGLPLAIELAAAQVAGLSVHEVAARLEADSAFLSLAAQAGASRQRTLEATFDWSYRLLDADEATLLRRLAIFDGGWTLDAAEQVCGGGMTRPLAALAALTTSPGSAADGAPGIAPLAALGAPVAALLSRLVDHSLVVRIAGAEASRYRLLRPIKEIAGERLATSGERPTLALVHGAYFVGIAAARRPDTTHASPADLSRIEADEANCLRALATFESQRMAAATLAMVAGLIEYWRIHGQLRGGRSRIERAIAIVDPATAPPNLRLLRAFGQAAAADLCVHLGEHDDARALLDESQVVFDAMGITVGRATSVAIRGNIAAAEGDAAGCFAWYRRAEAIMADGVPDVTRMFWLTNLGGFELQFGLVDEAWAHLSEARGLAPSIPETWYHSLLLGHLGTLARVRGEAGTALPLLVEALGGLVAYGARVEAVPVVEALAGITIDEGDPTRGATLLGAASILREVTGIGEPAATAEVSRDLRRIRDTLRLPVLGAAWARGRAMSLDDLLAFVWTIEDRPMPLRATPGTALTTRERDVALLVARGLTNAEIAANLGISVGTARIHVERILRKLGLSSRVQVATWVVEGGLEQAS